MLARSCQPTNESEWEVHEIHEEMKSEYLGQRQGYLWTRGSCCMKLFHVENIFRFGTSFIELCSLWHELWRLFTLSTSVWVMKDFRPLDNIKRKFTDMQIKQSSTVTERFSIHFFPRQISTQVPDLPTSRNNLQMKLFCQLSEIFGIKIWKFHIGRSFVAVGTAQLFLRKDQREAFSYQIIHSHSRHSCTRRINHFEISKDCCCWHKSVVRVQFFHCFHFRPKVNSHRECLTSWKFPRHNFQFQLWILFSFLFFFYRSIYMLSKIYASESFHLKTTEKKVCLIVSEEEEKKKKSRKKLSRGSSRVKCERPLG